MILRSAQKTILRLSKGFPIVGITGPRQSGKTTLARHVFPDKPYFSLEDPDIRLLAEDDPRGLLEGCPDGAVLDEVQRAPQLFSYLQTNVDEAGKTGMFVLTGSQQFGLLSGIGQSLAGRVGMVHLLPFAMSELEGAGRLPESLEEVIFSGFYPPIHDRHIAPADWFSSYVSTYVERDVRQLVNVRDISAFQRFVKMCAARTGQLLNLSSIAGDCGITHTTASSWISVLEASYIIYLLRPHHRNFNKRLIKSPKIYFHDVGLAAWLLNIQNADQLRFHSQRGPLFENLVISELLKKRYNAGLNSNLYFWRDSRGLEIDLLVENGEELIPMEIKSGRTPAADFFDSLKKWERLAGAKDTPSFLIYGGDHQMCSGNTSIIPWKEISRLRI